MNIDLYKDECLDALKEIKDKSVDLILVDLPYKQIAQKWDCEIDINKLWEQYDRVLKDNAVILLFASGTFAYELYNAHPKQFKYELIWKKNSPTGMNSASYRPMKYFEKIMVFIKGKTRKCTYNPIPKPRENEQGYLYGKYAKKSGHNNHIPNEMETRLIKYDENWVQPSDILEFKVVPNRGKLHCTQKPVDLLEWLIKTYSNEGDTVLDNAMGSASTGIACINLNRNFIGMEKYDDNYDVALNRILDKIQDEEKEIFLSTYRNPIREELK